MTTKKKPRDQFTGSARHVAEQFAKFEKRRGLKKQSWRTQGRIAFARRNDSGQFDNGERREILSEFDATPEPVNYDIGRGEV